MLRANYSYLDRYLLTFTGKVDGSSRFAEGQKYGFLPSATLGWNVAEESVMRHQKSFSNLKQRVSYGETRNTGINPHTTLGNLNRTKYVFGNTGVYRYSPNNISNPDLKWQTTASANIGLDFGLFSSRVSDSLEFYRQNTSDLLIQRRLPQTNGTSNVKHQNIGKTINSRIKLTLSTINIESKGSFTWTKDISFSKNKEEIVALYGDRKDDVGNGWFIGQPLTVFFDYKKTGNWQTNKQAEAVSYGQTVGGIKVRDRVPVDANGNITKVQDGKITEDDRIVLGSEVPDWTDGITNRFEYKYCNHLLFYWY